MIGNHFKKKFGKRQPPGIIVTQVIEKQFENVVESYGTAIPIQAKSYNIEKYEIINPIKYNHKFQKGEIITELKTRVIIAPFDGVIGKRDFSDDLEVSKTSILLNFEDASTIFTDVDIPEIFAPFIKEGSPVEIKFSGYEKKIYEGIIDSVASRINTENRSLAARIKMENSNLEILPGALLELSIKYNIRSSLGIPDTSVMMEGERAYVYKVSQKNIANKTEVEIGIRQEDKIEILSGINKGDIVVAEGLRKVIPRGKIKPINK
jgi:membrane fusion protein (multidrug efflux system)